MALQFVDTQRWSCCRYSDFMVNEVDARGQIVRLDNKLAPQVDLPPLITCMLEKRYLTSPAAMQLGSFLP